MNEKACGLEGDFIKALMCPTAPVPDIVTSWNGNGREERFAIYRNNVITSLVEALRQTYPVVQDLVGEDFFRAMAVIFVREFPPTSPVLAYYGRGLADFVESFEPAKSLPYLPDVARMEFARLCAYHAADAESLTTLGAEFSQASEEELGRAAIAFHPSAHLLRSPFAVGSLWAAHNGIGAIEDIDIDTHEAVLITRVDMEVAVVLISACDAEFVAALMSGAPLGDAIARAVELDGNFDLTRVVGTLVRQQALTSINLPRT